MRRLQRLFGATTLVLAASVAAERPTVVEDASTLERGGYKLEAGWSRVDRERGLEAAAGFAPLNNLELELAVGRARDHQEGLDLRAAGLAAKWVVLQQELGLSAGIKGELERVRARPSGGGIATTRTAALVGLFSWRFESGHIAHLNLGREWVRDRTDREAASTWGVGLEQPLGRQVQLTLEVFGAEGNRPDRQLGLRWEVATGVKLSAAIGSGEDGRLANAGVAWEF